MYAAPIKEICAFEYGTPPAASQELVIGHESLGEVVEVGPDVTRVELGDLVVPMVRRPCPMKPVWPVAQTDKIFASREILKSGALRKPTVLWPNSLSITKSI